MTASAQEGTAPLFVDARGLRCPWPVLRLAKAMREAERVTIAADDPAAPGEIAALAAARGWLLAREGTTFHLAHPPA